MLMATSPTALVVEIGQLPHNANSISNGHPLPDLPSGNQGRVTLARSRTRRVGAGTGAIAGQRMDCALLRGIHDHHSGPVALASSLAYGHMHESMSNKE